MSSRAAARACWHAQSRGTGPAGPPALAAVVAVSVVRRSGGRIKPCAAPPIRWCRHYDPPPPPGSRIARPPLRGGRPSRIQMTTTMMLTMAAAASGNVVGRTPLSSLSSLLTTMAMKGDERKCRGRAAGQDDERCCITYSVVCSLICHPPLSSSCNRQHFRRRPPSPITKLCQLMSYPSPSPLLSMVCC